MERTQRPVVSLGMYSLSTLGEHVMSTLSAITTTVTVVSANGALAVKVRPRRAITPVSLIWYSVTASGNYDIAITSSTGTRLWSKGTTAWPAAGTITETVTGVSLVPDVDYWIVFAADNTTGALRGMSGSAASGEQTKDMTGTASVLSVAASVMPIPAPVTLGSSASGRVPLVQVREA